MYLRKLLLIISFSLMSISVLMSQSEDFKPLPYASIPDYAEDYTAGTVASRFLDGLGFRFYWATEGLRPEDLDFRPGPESRSSGETISHIYDMTRLLARTVLQDTTKVHTGESFEEMRAAALKNIDLSSKKLRKSSDAEFDTYIARFSNGAEFPFWNLINGPIADCIWHCGQITSLRRMSGNPFNSKVSLFNGRMRAN